jgi:ribonuclease HII
MSVRWEDESSLRQSQISDRRFQVSTYERQIADRIENHKSPMKPDGVYCDAQEGVKRNLEAGLPNLTSRNFQSCQEEISAASIVAKDLDFNFLEWPPAAPTNGEPCHGNRE